MKTKLLLLFAILNLSIVSAQTFTVDGIKYTVIPITTNVEVVQKTPAYTGEIIIPSSVIYNSVTYSVTAIGPQAFFYCTDLTSISIPTSVTSIDGISFSNCTSLTSLMIPNSVTYIGQAAFKNCNGLTSITIPNSVTFIGESAFISCFGLTDVTISNAVTSIEADTFKNCTSLTSITIPNSVTSIGPGAFYNCTSITTVNFCIETPIAIDADVFGNVNQGICALNVPEGSVSLYQTTAVWQDFNPIQGGISCLLNTDSFTNKNKVSVYPNPVSNNLTIENPSSANYKVQVINNLGQLVLKQNQNSSSISLDVSNLSKGLYFLNIASEDGNSQTIKFIKN